MNSNKKKNYWDIPRFVLGLKISSDAKVMYGLLCNMDEKMAIKVSGFSDETVEKIFKELKENNLIIDDQPQNEHQYRKNQKIIKVNFKQKNY